MTYQMTRQTQPMEDVPEGASRGQVIVMFALFAMAMFGILGLAIDLGYAFAERRTVQNAADLAAIAGAREIVRNSVATEKPVTTAALPAMKEALAGNTMGGVTPVIDEDSCEYIDLDAVRQAPCSTESIAAVPVPASARGIKLTVSATHGTFFIRVFPGAPANLTVKATARAYVELTQSAGYNSPVLICGYGNKTWPDNKQIDVLLNNSTVNPAAIGKTFRLTGSKTQIPRCGTDSSSYDIAWNNWRGAHVVKKRLDGDADISEINEYWEVAGGKPAAFQNSVVGIEGCRETVAVPYNCIIAVPIACGTAQGCAAPTGTGSAGDPMRLYVVKVLAFAVQLCSGTTATGSTVCLSGTLLDDYLLSEMTYPGGGERDWCRDCGGVVGIKLNQPES